MPFCYRKSRVIKFSIYDAIALQLEMIKMPSAMMLALKNRRVSKFLRFQVSGNNYQDKRCSET